MKRKLKIEADSDCSKRYKHCPPSKVRLKGQWLRRLGFEPGQYVELTVISRGVLELRLCCANPALPSAEFGIAAMRLDHAIAADEARRKAGL